MDSTRGCQHERPLWCGVLFATLATPVALTLIVLMTAQRIASDHLLAGIGTIAIVTMPIAFLAITLLGLPAILLLRWRNWLNWATVCGGGVLVAMLANLLVVGLVAGRLASIGQTMLVSFIGLVAGIAFCVGAKVAYRPPAKFLASEIG